MQNHDDCDSSAKRISDPSSLKTLLITGASGFVGTHFIHAFKNNFYIYALARRSQHDAGIKHHPNIQWIRADIGEEEQLKTALEAIAVAGGVDFIFHFAGYYDFTNRDHQEYLRTNVNGTRNLLRYSEMLGVKRFIFSSSLTVTNYVDSAKIIKEESPADADFPYAVSKREAEELIKQYSGTFPCTIVRFAAIFSDWCEYAPLYVLLKSWMEKGKIKGRCIPGKGKTALPYLHIRDLTAMFVRIINKHKELSDLDILIASPDGCVDQNDLFHLANRYFKGETVPPVHLPKTLTWLGVAGINLIGRVVGELPFERPWMLKYLDHRMEINSSKTREILDWRPTPRYHITRRLLFLIINMRYRPDLWETRNKIMTKKTAMTWPGLKISQAMEVLKFPIVTTHVNYLCAPENSSLFTHYQSFDRETVFIRAELTYDMFELTIRSGDRKYIQCYAHSLARQRLSEGVSFKEFSSAITHMANTIEQALLTHEPLSHLSDMIYNEVGVTLQLIMDEIEEVYEQKRAG